MNLIDLKPPTPADLLLVVATLLGSLGIVLTVLTSLRAVRAELRSSAFDSMTDRMLELDRFFVDRPELREYFYYGAHPPAEGDVEHTSLLLRLEAASEYLLDLFDTYLLAEDRNDHPIFPKGWWDDYMSHIYERSPALRACKRTTLLLGRHPEGVAPDGAALGS